MVRLPVAMAGGSRTVVDWKFAPIWQPRPHGVAKTQVLRPSIWPVTTAPCIGITGTPILRKARS